MLKVTETATDVIGEITEQPDLPETAGLRITSEDEDEGAPLAAVLTGGPGPQDEVLELDGHGRVYLDPAVTDHLADRVLDAEKDAEGEVVFHVRRQAHTDDPGVEDVTEPEHA